MKLEPECIGCLFNQVLRSFKTLKPEISSELIISAQKKIMEYLLSIDTNNISAPIIGGFTYNLITETIGVKDPYKQIKKKYNQLALSYYDALENIIDKAEDSLLEAILVAALGNTVDFATQHEIDLINDIKNFSLEDLKINDYKEFKKSIEMINEKNGTLLILGDNVGEIVFDKLLIRTIKKIYPDLKIIYSVRSAPIINDATMEDAKSIGLTDIVKVIEASPIPGIQFSTATEEFRKYFYEENGMILSKGQGNFETLFGTDIPDKDLYYLLKAKCNLMERIFDVKIGSLIFKKKTANF